MKTKRLGRLFLVPRAKFFAMPDMWITFRVGHSVFTPLFQTRRYVVCWRVKWELSH